MMASAFGRDVEEEGGGGLNLPSEPDFSLLNVPGIGDEEIQPGPRPIHLAQIPSAIDQNGALDPFDFKARLSVPEQPDLPSPGGPMLPSMIPQNDQAQPFNMFKKEAIPAFIDTDDFQPSMKPMIEVDDPVSAQPAPMIHIAPRPNTVQRPRQEPKTEEPAPKRPVRQSRMKKSVKLQDYSSGEEQEEEVIVQIKKSSGRRRQKQQYGYQDEMAALGEPRMPTLGSANLDDNLFPPQQLMPWAQQQIQNKFLAASAAAPFPAVVEEVVPCPLDFECPRKPRSASKARPRTSRASINRLKQAAHGTLPLGVGRSPLSLGLITQSLKAGSEGNSAGDDLYASDDSESNSRRRAAKRHRPSSSRGTSVGQPHYQQPPAQLPLPHELQAQQQIQMFIQQRQKQQQNKQWQNAGNRAPNSLTASVPGPSAAQRKRMEEIAAAPAHLRQAMLQQLMRERLGAPFPASGNDGNGGGGAAAAVPAAPPAAGPPRILAALPRSEQQQVAQQLMSRMTPDQRHKLLQLTTQQQAAILQQFYAEHIAPKLQQAGSAAQVSPFQQQQPFMQTATPAPTPMQPQQTSPAAALQAQTQAKSAGTSPNLPNQQQPQQAAQQGSLGMQSASPGTANLSGRATPTAAPPAAGSGPSSADAALKDTILRDVVSGLDPAVQAQIALLPPDQQQLILIRLIRQHQQRMLQQQRQQQQQNLLLQHMNGLINQNAGVAAAAGLGRQQSGQLPGGGSRGDAGPSQPSPQKQQRQANPQSSPQRQQQQNRGQRAAWGGALGGRDGGPAAAGNERARADPFGNDSALQGILGAADDADALQDAMNFFLNE